MEFSCLWDMARPMYWLAKSRSCFGVRFLQLVNGLVVLQGFLVAHVGILVEEGAALLEVVVDLLLPQAVLPGVDHVDDQDDSQDPGHVQGDLEALALLGLGVLGLHLVVDVGDAFLLRRHRYRRRRHWRR
jgi:hypothetical protein